MIYWLIECWLCWYDDDKLCCNSVKYSTYVKQWTSKNDSDKVSSKAKTKPRRHAHIKPRHVCFFFLFPLMKFFLSKNGRGERRSCCCWAERIKKNLHTLIYLLSTYKKNTTAKNNKGILRRIDRYRKKKRWTQMQLQSFLLPLVRIIIIATCYIIMPN